MDTLSDFFVYKDCPYIQFEDLQYHLTNNGLRLKATYIWYRNILINILKITESQFIEFYILMNNYIIKDYSKELFIINNKKK